MGPTFGQKAVGMSFNPSGDPKVKRIKELYAEIIDLLSDGDLDNGATGLYGRILGRAINDAMGAQMWAVKAVTFGQVPSQPAAGTQAGLEPAAPAEERKLPEGRRMVRTKSSGDRVYMLDETKKTRQWIYDPLVLESLGFELSDVGEVEDNELLKYSMGPAILKPVAKDATA